MPPEQADNIDVVDRASDHKIDSQSDLNRSLWDEMKSTLGASGGKRESKPEELEEGGTLEFSLDGLYNSIHDGLSRAVTGGRQIAQSDLGDGEGPTGESRSLRAQDDDEFDATPVQEIQYRDVIANSSPPDRNPDRSGDEAQQALQQLLKQAGDGAVPVSSAVGGPERAEKPVDVTAMAKAAEAINKACNEGALFGAGTDKEAIFAILKDKTKAEREEIDKAFEKKYGHSLETEFRDELSGADLDKALNLLNRKNGDAGDAGRIHTALIERDQVVAGRSDENCEKDIRDTLATMNSKEIEQLDKTYKDSYGTGVREALRQDENLSEATKAVVEVYLKGTDQRTDADTGRLADTAVKAHNIEMFAEAFRSSTPEARKAFLDNGGERKMQEAFGKPDTENGRIVYESTPALEHAREIVAKGEVGLASKISDNLSWAGDNEKAIELELSKLSSDERHSYVVGRELAQGKDVDGVTEKQKQQALEFYKTTHDAIEKAGNPTEVARWEDLILHGEETLVGKLASHRGTVFDDSTHDVLSTIENMSENDWNLYKESPEFRQEVDQVLKTYLNEGELERCNKILDKKEAASTFGNAQEYGRRSVFEVLADNPPIKGSPEATADRILDAIAGMNSAERQLYKDNPQFREILDQQVEKALPDAEDQLAAAKHMLDQVEGGKPGSRDIVAKLYMHASADDTDEAAVIHDVRNAFEADPKLHERIKNPATPEDKAYAEKFKESLHRALDDGEYERYAKPLIETGRLPIDVQVELEKGHFNDDEHEIYKDIVGLATDKDPAAQNERQRLLSDLDYREKVLGALNDDEKRVALYALMQGEMRPEDMLRSYMVGAGTDQEEIKQLLAEIKDPENYKAQGLTKDQIDAAIAAKLEDIKDDYVKKYNSDLTYDLMDELGGQDKDDARRAIRRDATNQREAFNEVRDEAYESRDGFGKAWVDQQWDGTGYQADAELDAYSQAMSEYSRRFAEMPSDQRKELTDNLTRALDLYKQSEVAAGDAVVDGVIIAAALGGAAYTGGVSLELLAVTGVAGAAFKVGTKSAIMGADYDWTSSQAIVDGATGAIDAATTVVGPGQLAQLARIGEKAAVRATTAVLKEGGEALIKEGGQQALEKGMKQMMANAIANGARGIDDKAIGALAKEVATDGNAEALEAAIKKNLTEAIKTESESALKNTLREVALNSTAGGIAGGLSGGVRGAAEWDGSKSFTDNMTAIGKNAAITSAFGAGAAGSFTVLLKGTSSAVHGIKEHYNLKPGDKLSAAQLEEVAKLTGVEDAKLRYDNDGNLVLEGKSEQPAVRSADDASGPGRQGRSGADETPPAAKDGSNNQPLDRSGNTREVDIDNPRSAEHGDVREYKPHPDGRDPVADPEAIAQSNRFKDKHEIDGKLQDGFQMVGGDTRIDANGRFVDANRPSTVVDRTQDEVLRKAIADAHQKFDHLKNDPAALAEALAKYSNDLMTPKGPNWQRLPDSGPDGTVVMRNNPLDIQYAKYFREANANKQILLGEFIDMAAHGQGGGVCQHQALLFKVLGDEFGLDVNIVSGIAGADRLTPGSTPNHAWNEVVIDGQRLLYDPRNDLNGFPLDAVPFTPGRDAPWLNVAEPSESAVRQPRPRADAVVEDPRARGGDGERTEIVDREKTEIIDREKTEIVDREKTEVLDRERTEILDPDRTLEMRLDQRVMRVEADQARPRQRAVEIDGEQFPLTDRSAPWKEDGDAYWFHGRSTGDKVDNSLKLHVMTDSPQDLERLQKVLIPALEKDPELRALVPEYKTRDPNYAFAKGQPPDAVPNGVGQESKAFTVYLKDADDAARVQQILDRHIHEAGLDLQKPLATGTLDHVSGGSNRVGIVRDRLPQAVDAQGHPGVKVDQQLAERIHARAGVAHGEQLTPAQLTQIESSIGLKEGSLAYDSTGALMLRGSDTTVSPQYINEFADKLDLPPLLPWERFGDDQLRALEDELGITPDQLYYNQNGELMQRAKPSSRSQEYYLQEDGVSAVPRGEFDPKTGRASEGLEDRYAYYELAESYGLNPTEMLNPPPLEFGTQVSVGNTDYLVLGNDGGNALLMKPDAPLRIGQPVSVSDTDLATSFTKVGDLGHYRDADGTYYILRDDGQGGKELVPDYNILPMKRRNVAPRNRA